ncbi:transposase [Kitasatospora sp. NBC_00039]|uniref:transposase n=1 Tax=Kitasatospora sp. NBC_00039 TaxID=2903565 RepID=UPI003865CAC0
MAGRPRSDDRAMPNGIVWKPQTGTSWRDVPERYGSWLDPVHAFPQVGGGRHVPAEAPCDPGGEGRGRGHRLAGAGRLGDHAASGRRTRQRGHPA